MLSRPVRLVTIWVLALLLALIGARAAVQLFTEVLWFQSVDYTSVFWTRFGIEAIVRIVAGIFAAGLVLLNLWFVLRSFGTLHVRRRYGDFEIAEQVPRKYIGAGITLAAILTGWWLSSLKFAGGAALVPATWLHRTDWGFVDPLFGKDASFFVFSLPFYHQITDFLLLCLFTAMILTIVGYFMVGAVRLRDNRIEVNHSARLHLVALAATAILTLGIRYWLGRYDLMLDGYGIGGAIGYTDVVVRVPAHRLIAMLAVATSVTLVYGAWRRNWMPPLFAGLALVLAAVGVAGVLPAIVQKFRVEPNQLAREAEYIEWHMDFTRRGFDLHRLERRRFPYSRADVATWETLEATLERLPLWDPEPLKTTLMQLQSIFPYYHFPQVTFDRYATEQGLQQVALAVREFLPAGLSDAARTWQTLRLKPLYHRGAGVVVAPAAQSDRGEPIFWISEIDPVRRSAAAPPELDITEPNVYIGQSMRHYVLLIPGFEGDLVGEPGRDFPRGIELSSLARSLAVAWRFWDKNILFSGEITRDTHILFRRSVHERVQALAPFILWDAEPYPVLADGRVTWILDGYTASASFPLSRAIRLQGVGQVRYLRNSVKVTVDAGTGKVAFFVVDDEDPVLATYRSIFPELFSPLRDLSVALTKHLRYPALYLNAQAEILREYHLQRAEAFYAGQDFWQLPQLPGRGLILPYGATYAVLRLPGNEQPEFLSVLPFIARERLNMTALLVGRNDPPNYGELLLLELPRDQRIAGPTQVRALIEQDPVISAQLTLWRQGGSDVDIGRLRLVPLDSSFLYIEPLFLSAQGNPIPELWRVVVSDGRSVIMAETLAEAIRGLSAGQTGTITPSPSPGVELEQAPERWPQQALELLDEADRRLRAGDFAGFGSTMSELRELLRRLATDRY